MNKEYYDIQLDSPLGQTIIDMNKHFGTGIVLSIEGVGINESGIEGKVTVSLKDEPVPFIFGRLTQYVRFLGREQKSHQLIELEHDDYLALIEMAKDCRICEIAVRSRTGHYRIIVPASVAGHVHAMIKDRRKQDEL